MTATGGKEKKWAGAIAITPAQVKRIHVLKGVLGLDDDTYRAILAERFKAGSCKDLNTFQADMLIEDLEQKAVALGKWEKRPVKIKKYSDLECRTGGMASTAQLRKIEAMWQEISRVDDPEGRKKALRRFLERIAKVSDLRFLDMAGAGKVINALEAMKKQA